MINFAVGVLIAALPYLASGVVSASDLPPILAYIVFPGRDLLLLLGGIVVAWTALRGRVAMEPFAARLEAITRHRAFALCALVLVAIVSFARVPQQEKEADAFGGDEPKYLRIAFSLLRDTDADVSGGSTLNLFRPVVVPEGHVWNAGNWTVRGLDGGLYHLQPPGLPALVAVALGIGEAVLPGRDPGIYVFVLLALVWILAARELWLLSLDLTGDSLGSAVLVGLVFLSAPVYVGGYQLFPEALSLWIFPWLIRRLRTSDRTLGPASALACGLMSGYLLWIHPKLTVVAALFLAIGLFRPDTKTSAKGWFALGFFATAFTSLLYCHHISGLFRPEGLYIRQAEEYVGSPNPFSLRFAAGLVKALVGGRDGLLVFAPVLVLGGMALSALKRPSRSTVEIWCLFGVVWLTSAVHDGASLGSPARLMAPVVFVPALFLTLALRGRAPASFKATTVLLFVFGGQITDTMSSDWRRNVNPYRTMFANSATNFEPSLPGNSFSDPAYGVDLEKAALILVVLAIATTLMKRSATREPGHLAPAGFGAGVLATMVVLGFGLHWLTPP